MGDNIKAALEAAQLRLDPHRDAVAWGLVSDALLELAAPAEQPKPVAFPNRRHVEEAIKAAENPTGMQLNDGKERVTLPGGTLRLMLRLIDAAAPSQSGTPQEREAFPEAIKTWPKRIWLQHGDEHEMPSYLEVCKNEAEVTWCRDHIESADIPYIRADLAASPSPDAADAARYRWLKAHAGNSLHLTRNGDHACNYVSAREWIDDCAPDDFADNSADEIQRMKETNTIWRLQVYPHTPVGFYACSMPTLDEAIDAAMQKEGK